MDLPDIDAAARFLRASGRVLDCRRFDRLVHDGEATPVRDAVAAYRNADGGFGHGLEPDARTPTSQPLAIDFALHTLHTSDAWDDRLVAGACDWLQQNAPDEGGAASVEDTVTGSPHAPWLVPADGHPASVITTGLIAGTLHARAVVHPWLDRATELMWSRIDDMATGDPGQGAEPDPDSAYQWRAVLRFLSFVPDRDRATEALWRVRAVLLGRGLVTLDPDAPGEVHGPLDYAPEPDTLARSLFDEATIADHLDHLARGQREDGGWMFNWLVWDPVVEREWRASITVDALAVLRANGRW